MSTKYTKELLEEAAQNSESIAGVLRYLGIKQAGGSQSHIGRKLKEFEVDTSHFTGARWNKGKTFKRLQKNTEDILVKLPEGSRRPRRSLLLRAMIDSGLAYTCKCGNDGSWRGQPITLEIDHIDGDWLNNELTNLRFLCPNCHSQEPTNRSWKSRGEDYEFKTSTMSDLEFIERLSTGGSLHKATTVYYCDCGAGKSKDAKLCLDCEYRTRKGRPGKQQIEWPSCEDLLDMLAASNYTKVAEQLGCSDNAIRKHLVCKI